MDTIGARVVIGALFNVAFFPAIPAERVAVALTSRQLVIATL